MIDLRSKLAHLADKRAARRARATLEKWGHSPFFPAHADRLREAQQLLAADEPARALAIVDELIDDGHNDVTLAILWAQAAAALGRYREAFTINASAIKLADAGKHTRIAASCRSWQRELAWRVARDS